ncbi:MAG TPA: FAD-dependent oxidoreductase [Gemmatimonadaceae bacterium]|nr:FAD-dependent oxidoreductase [Gemmatimonadaceae bacterium]
MPEPHVVILGAGPAGLGAAWQLRRAGKARVTVLERNGFVGGNASSFESNGIWLDFGSHRLHPATDPAILADIKRLLGDDLRDRPRHGRILLRDKLIHFPLKPVDLLLRLDKRFALSTLRDMARKALAKPDEGDTFASVLWANLGPTICRDFYFPFARKMWGREPEELSAIQARKRVSAGSFGKLLRKVLSSVPGLKPPGAGRFFYPVRGFGQISEAYAAAARDAGAEIALQAAVTGLSPLSGNEAGWCVTMQQNGEQRTIRADYVWSTIPVTLLARMVTPLPPDDVVRATTAIDYRAMILVYLELDVDRFTEYDAHYVPDERICFTRLSETKNYSARGEPRGRTVLCAELPCSTDDPWWTMGDAELGERVARDLAVAGLALPRPPVNVFTRRLRQAYPIYQKGYEVPYGILDDWVESLPRFLSYGRQGLFAHDNTHHALAMAYAAVECLNDGEFDAAAWARHRKVFESHVVED